MVAIGAMILTPLADTSFPAFPRDSYAAIAYIAAVGRGGADRLYRRDLFRNGLAYLRPASRRSRTGRDIALFRLGAAEDRQEREKTITAAGLRTSPT